MKLLFILCVEIQVSADKCFNLYPSLPRDLVAKNIFISHENMAKVSNFWLTGDATHSHAGWKLPIKWTAPEAIEDGVSI